MSGRDRLVSRDGRHRGADQTYVRLRQHTEHAPPPLAVLSGRRGALASAAVNLLDHVGVVVSAPALVLLLSASARGIALVEDWAPSPRARRWERAGANWWLAIG